MHPRSFHGVQGRAQDVFVANIVRWETVRRENLRICISICITCKRIHPRSMGWMRHVSRKMGFVFLRFSAFTCSSMARLSLTNSRSGTCYPSLRDFVEWARGRPYASPRRARASLMYVTRARPCTRVYKNVCAKRVYEGYERYIGRGEVVEGGSILK